MSWLSDLLPGIKTRKPESENPTSDGVWEKCEQCNTALYTPDWEKSCWVCSNCNYHSRLSATQWASVLFDTEPTATELAVKLRSIDFLKFVDSQPYEERLKKAQQGNQHLEAAQLFSGTIVRHKVIALLFNFKFMGGSMGSVVGERFARGVDEAIAQRVPFITCSASGGARMQEGLTSLFQMAKTNSALAQLAQYQLPHISILSDPTTGGVAASFAMIGDIVIAEPNALIGFAGPRVIQETVRERLPEGFQSSSFLADHGAIDLICDRRQLREKLDNILSLLPPVTEIS